MSKSTRDALQEYVNLGFSVFPVREDKRPAVLSWEKYQTDRMTAEEVLDVSRECTSMGRVVSGLAVATGEISGVTVIDLDLGAENPFVGVKTPVARTGSGGLHYYFKYTDKLHTTSNTTLKIDIRNDGGYAILPPSTTTKGKYSWIEDLSTPLSEVPEHFLNSYTSGVINHKWSFDGMENGGRNNASKSVVGYLVKTLRNDLDLAWASFRAWNERNDPPIEEEQLRATFEWCVNKDTTNNPQMKRSLSFSDMSDEELLSFSERPTARTGLNNIDTRFPHPTGFYLICANPGVGKGWYALWLTRKFYENNGIKSVYFSLEMSTDLIKQRILQAWSDLTEEQFVKFKGSKEHFGALKLLKQDAIRVDEFGGSDTSGQNIDNFKQKMGEYYADGFRAFHFDHFHELDGANVNDKNQQVSEKWAKAFQSICKDYPDIWLFVYVQPNGISAKKNILERTDVSGSKAITQKCEFFISLNRKIKKDEETEEASIDETERQVTIYIDKNRITSAQHIGFKVFFSRTGNFVANEEPSFGIFNYD